MVSAIDPSKPADGVPAVKADLRANLLAAKNEIEALQTIAAASVKQFGAAGDGVTDDTAAIQAAIDVTSAAGGGMVFFPAGVYIISASVAFRPNVIVEGEYGGTMIEMADGANIAGMFTSSGAIPFFGMRNMILYGNKANQTTNASIALKLNHSTTSSGYGNNSLIGQGNEIVDTQATFENIVIASIDGPFGIDSTSSSSCYFRNVAVLGVNGVGIRSLINDGTWFDCLVGSTWHEGWICTSGSGRYYGCKAFFTGTGFNPANGTFGNYNRGGGFRILNSNQLFVGCEGQDTDGPAFMVQANNVTLSGCHATQPCNLTGISANEGQTPIRGGGYNVSLRCAVWMNGASHCQVDVLARDKLIGGANTPNLAGLVVLQAGASDNVVVITGDPAMIAAGTALIREVSISAYSQHNYVVTPFGPWRARRTLAANDATPLVFGGGIFTTANGTATVITDFDFVRAGAAIGEEFLLRINDNNTTVQNGANIVTRSGSNITAQGIYRFIDVGGTWHEV